MICTGDNSFVLIKNCVNYRGKHPGLAFNVELLLLIYFPVRQWAYTLISIPIWWPLHELDVVLTPDFFPPDQQLDNKGVLLIDMMTK